MTPAARERLVAALARRGLAPCGDSSCLLAPPGGMATNGGCRCVIADRRADPSDVDRTARALAAVARDLHAEAERLRAEVQAQVAALEGMLVATPFPPASITRADACALTERLRAIVGGTPVPANPRADWTPEEGRRAGVPRRKSAGRRR